MTLSLGPLWIGALGLLTILFVTLGLLFLLGCRKIDDKYDAMLLEEAIRTLPVTEANFWYLMDRLMMLPDGTRKKELGKTFSKKYNKIFNR